ncbi:dihydroneopterin aldolase [Planctobacterium marinum]|uniref:7,8-dihydroneopterin aldolase n=1 Tax=Planctobacterium marinum TaxID=1631968 RepID=A0AA48KRD0_9ALTE|nr:7,8-dihydroneopterin aldolase [Planctobacterium marinum]
MDKIIINGLLIDTIIGVYDWEREKSQRVILNLVLKTDLNLPMQSDNVADTIDYAAIVQRIEKLAEQHRPELLERFAELIFADLFSLFPLTEIQLQILKPDILQQVDTIGIEITRTRELYVPKGVKG